MCVCVDEPDEGVVVVLPLIVLSSISGFRFVRARAGHHDRSGYHYVDGDSQHHVVCI